jgi:protocatechuate 3,4-dioxygenase beta subunit
VRNVTRDSITDAFAAYCAGTPDARTKLLLTRLAAHLHAYAREVNLTHREWLAGIDMLYRAGRISTPERNEFILFSDVFGLSSLVDMLGTAEGRTEGSVLGPFHVAGSRWLELGGDAIGDNAGDHVVFLGRVLDAASGKPVPGAVLDVWQTAANGLYSNQDPQQPAGNLRFRMRSTENGSFAFTTVRPAPYTVPDDGPAGDMLHATARQPWRPSHFHFIVSAEGREPLTTEIFPDDDPHLDADAVFGVREALVVRFEPQTDPGAIPVSLAARERLRRPFYVVRYDFRI